MFAAGRCRALSRRRLKYYQQKWSLTVCPFGDKPGSSAEEKRTGQQRLQALGDKLLSLRDVADGSFLSLFNLLSAEVVLNVPKPQTEINTAFKHIHKRKLFLYWHMTHRSPYTYSFANSLSSGLRWQIQHLNTLGNFENDRNLHLCTLCHFFDVRLLLMPRSVLNHIWRSN